MGVRRWAWGGPSRRSRAGAAVPAWDLLQRFESRVSQALLQLMH